MNEQEIHDICKNFGIKNYTINSYGSIDVNDDVNISARGLTEIPLRFNNVNGYFNCSHNNLTTLKNCPIYVGDWFDCSYNQLTSLDGCSEYIRLEFFCSRNPLTSLYGYNLQYKQLVFKHINLNLYKYNKILS
jgi:hypothetical protein